MLDVKVAGIIASSGGRVKPCQVGKAQAPRDGFMKTTEDTTNKKQLTDEGVRGRTAGVPRGSAGDIVGALSGIIGEDVVLRLSAFIPAHSLYGCLVCLPLYTLLSISARARQ